MPKSIAETETVSHVRLGCHRQRYRYARLLVRDFAMLLVPERVFLLAKTGF